MLILLVGYFFSIFTLLDREEECPKAIGSFLMVRPFMAFSAFFIDSSLMKLIQQYLEKCNFLAGSERVMFWNPSSFPTISKISNLEMFLGMALMKMVFTSGSNE